MTDLGDLVGSMMSGLLKARKISDEQTAALAEYYKENPLLEGLSVPRIRIPEISIDFPILIENHSEGEEGVIEESANIKNAITEGLKATLETNKIKTNPAFDRILLANIDSVLTQVKKSNTPIVSETISRGVQNSFSDALKKANLKLTIEEEKIVAQNLRSIVSKTSFQKRPVSSGIIGNIRTADVKEKSTPTSVARIKITLKEEGLEWATQSSESGGVTRTLQPE